MTERDQHAKRAAADRDRIALADAPELARHLGHEARIVIAAPAELHERLGAAAVTPEMREARLEVGRPAAAPGELRVEPLRLRAPELGLPPRREPARVADVVRMEMRDEHATHGPAVEARREDALPQGARVVEPDTRVHDGPAVAVLEQPQVDVVELKRQRHTQPADAGRDDHDIGGGGRRGPRASETWAVQCTLRSSTEPDLLSAAHPQLGGHL